MKLLPVTKIDKSNKTTLKKYGDDVISKNYDVITIFSNLQSIWSNLEAGIRMHSL